MIYICETCCYETYRKDAFMRHQNSEKHKLNILIEPYQECEKVVRNGEKVVRNGEKVVRNCEKVVRNCEKVVHDSENELCYENNIIYSCKKCNKNYKSNRYLKEHEKKCNGIDSLTCPKCMKRFSNIANKINHCKRNTCKPVSIFESDNVKNIINNYNTNCNNQSYTNSLNTVNNTNVTNIYINDYGKERKDYLLAYDNFYDIIKAPNNNILVKYLKCKNFNPQFPENHCIKYENKKFKMKENNKWSLINANALKERLYYDCGSEVLNVFGKHENQIRNHIENKERFEEVKRKANFFELQLEGSDKEIKDRMLDIIKDDIE